MFLKLYCRNCPRTCSFRPKKYLRHFRKRCHSRCLQQLRELGILVRFSRHEIELSELDQLEKLLEEQEEAEWG